MGTFESTHVFSLFLLKFNYKAMKRFCWTDSLDCLFSIDNTKKIWKKVIQTHVLKIRDTLEGASWLFCSWVQNHADIPIRGSFLKDDDIKKLWLEGPPFLQLYQEDWPSTKNLENYKCNESHCLAELSNSDIDTDMKNIFSFEKCNSFDKLITIASFVLRFIDNIKLRLENNTLVVGNLTLDEINCAKCLFIKRKQKGFLSNNEIKKELANNFVFLNKNGLLCVKGRLQDSLLPYKTKFPILHNRNGLLVRAINFDCHRKVLHSGFKDTLNELRCNFWVTQGRRAVKFVISKCLICYKQHSK